MSELYVSPKTGLKILKQNDYYVSEDGTEIYPIINSIPRFSQSSNYTESFGYQWNKYDSTQLDSNNNCKLSNDRFYKTTNWIPEIISNQKVLEVGSGAGRFTEVYLKTTEGILYSLDYSNSVEANYKNNSKFKERLKLSQASIYQMPFLDNTFDKVFCLGVLQHTPSFKESLRALVNKTKSGGEIIIDFYHIKGWYTMIHSKYILRPLTTKLSHKMLDRLIKSNIDWMLILFDFFCLIKLKILTRFIPICDVSVFPENLSKSQRKKWAIMDTFDAFSPKYDNPMRIKKVRKLLIEMGCKVNFSGLIKFDKSASGAVVRAIKL